MSSQILFWLCVIGGPLVCLLSTLYVYVWIRDMAIIAHILETGRPVPSTAKYLDVSEASVNRHCKRYHRDGFYKRLIDRKVRKLREKGVF